MRWPQATMHEMLMAVACASVALAAFGALQREECHGNALLGFWIVAVCVVGAAVITAVRACKQRFGLKTLLRSLAVAVVLIGVPDAVFVASYLFLSDGRWYVVPSVDGPRMVNRTGAMDAAIIAVGVALLLRLRRSGRATGGLPGKWRPRTQKAHRLTYSNDGQWLLCHVAEGALSKG